MIKRILGALFYFVAVHVMYFKIASIFENSTAKHLIEIIYYFLAILAIYIWLNINLNNGLKRIVNNQRKIICWIIVGFLSALLIQFIFIYFKSYLYDIVQESSSTQELAKLIKQNTLSIINPIIIAPIFEELVFRKVIFNEIHKRYPFWFASILSALPFAILHADLFNMILYIIIAVILAYSYKKSGSIIVPIIIHMLLNAIPTITILFTM